MTNAPIGSSICTLGTWLGLLVGSFRWWNLRGHMSPKEVAWRSLQAFPRFRCAASCLWLRGDFSASCSYCHACHCSPTLVDPPRNYKVQISTLFCTFSWSWCLTTAMKSNQCRGLFGRRPVISGGRK